MTTPAGARRDTPPEVATFPYDRKCPYSMPEEYAILRESAGLQRVEHFDGFPMWVATRYADVRQALADGSMRNNRSHPNYPTPVPIPEGMKGGGSMLCKDGEEHRAERRLALPEFTTRQAETLRPTVEKIVDEVIDRIVDKGHEADLIEVGVQVAMEVITTVLGITSDDLNYLHGRTLIMFDWGHSREDRQTAVTEMNRYFEEIVERKLAEPANDALSRIVERAPEPKDIPRLAELTRLLLNGGSDSTAAMVGTGMLVLLTHPDQLAKVRDEPELMPAAVEELLRFISVADTTTPRVAAEPTTVGSTQVARDEAIFPLTGAANRDPDHFPEPDTLDVTRSPNSHVAFGFGSHYCLGADLSRVELQTVYSKLLERLPHLRLAQPLEEILTRSGLIQGAVRVPVRWDPPGVSSSSAQEAPK